MRYLLIYLFALMALSGCDYNRFDELPQAEPTTLIANTPLLVVAQHYRNGGKDLPSETIVSGTVTTCDSASNFANIIIIQHDTTSLTILTGARDSYTAYRPGDQVAVRLDGLRLGLHEGMLAVGTPAPGQYDTYIDEISSEAVVRRIIVRTPPNTRPSRVDTLFLSASEVTARMAGRLVRITGGNFTQGGRQTWGDETNGARTYSDIKDAATLKVYTNRYATFADDILPRGAVDLLGIVTIHQDVIQLKISSADDVFRQK